MTVIATAQVTLVVTVDVQKVDTFYCLTAIGASQPSIDTSTATPSGWYDTEPEYDSSKQLWTCQRTTLTDTTFYWGAVSKSSSYSGANSAWNKADAAQGSANSAVISSVPLYYRSTTASSPAINAGMPVVDSGDATDAWSTVMPKPKKGYTFFTCEKYVHVGGGVTFSTVRPLDNATYASMWCSAADSLSIDGGAIYAHSVTADKLAARSISIGALAEDVTDRIDSIEEAASDAAGLAYDNSWTLTRTRSGSGVYSFEATARRGGVDITDDLPDEFFTWHLRTEDGTEEFLGNGKTMDVQASSAGYHATVVGGLEEQVGFAVATSSGDRVVDEQGRRLIGIWKA